MSVPETLSAVDPVRPADVQRFLDLYQLTHARLAELLGIREFTVTRWVNGIAGIGTPIVTYRALRDLARELESLPVSSRWSM